MSIDQCFIGLVEKMVDLRQILKSVLPIPARHTLSQFLIGLKATISLVPRLYLQAARSERFRRFLKKGGKKRDVILFVSPEAGLGPFYMSSVIMARTLQEAGHRALMLSCDGIQPICSLKMAMRLGPTQSGDKINPACQRCRAAGLRINSEYDLPDLSIEKLLTSHNRMEIKALLEKYSEAPWSLMYDGIKFGGAAAGETLRDRRKLDVNEFSLDDIELVRALVHSALLIYFSIRNLTNDYQIKRVAHFGDYSYWVPADVFVGRLGIPVTRLDHAYNLDVDHRYVGLRSGNANAHMLIQTQQWPDFRDRPINNNSVTKIADSALYRLQGHGGVSTYSPNWAIRESDLLARLNLSKSRKTLVAYTSSTDEFICIREYLGMLGIPYAQGNKPFADQVAWLRALTDWVGARDDVQLIVRQHPRMAPDSRNSAFASLAAQMREQFEQTPSNVVILWPESKVSSYNIAELADVALVAWSNLALELARFGLPAIAAFPNIAPYPFGNFIQFEEKPQAYFAAIESLIDKPANLDLMTESFRWSNFLNWSPVVDVSDLVPTFDAVDVPPWRAPKRSDAIVRILADGEDVCSLNMDLMQKNAASYADERKAMIATIERYLAFFFGATNWRSDTISGQITSLAIDPSGLVSVTIDGKKYSRDTRLVRRLATLYNEVRPIAEETTTPGSNFQRV